MVLKKIIYIFHVCLLVDIDVFSCDCINPEMSKLVKKYTKMLGHFVKFQEM